jgi:hypothetical protein
MATAEKRKRTESTDTHSSNIWDSFIKNPTDGSKATCRKCRKVVSRGKSNAKSKSWGNGPLWNHFKTCSPAGSSSSTTQLSLAQTLSRNTPFAKESVKAKAITNAIAMMVAVDLRPYSIVENDGFKDLMKVVEPRYHMVSRKELTNTVIPEIVSDLEGKIKGSMQSSQSGINFTTDMWKCEGQNREYMTVTAHWVVEDDQLKCFMVKNALLVVEEFLDSAHAYNIRKSVGIKNIYSMWYSGIVTELIKLIFIELIEVGLCLFCNTINTFK